MGIIHDQRAKIARVIGAKFANELSDEQLPAILNAIDGDETEVRMLAQRAAKGDNPPGLLMYLLRERKHTGLLPPPGPALPYGVPEPSTPEQHLVEVERMREWKRIQTAMDRRQDIRDLYHDLHDSKADPGEVRETMIAVLDEMNRQREEAQA